MKKDLANVGLSFNCSRITVINTLKHASELGLSWETVKDWTNEELTKELVPSYTISTSYRKPDYDYIHREMAKSGVTLCLLWVEYCEHC